MFRPSKKQIDLLMQLRKDGRQSFTEMSRKVNMPVSTIFDRVRARKEDVIKRFTCLLDFGMIGFNCRAQMVFRIRKEDRGEMQKHFLTHPNINAVYKINNGYDFLVEAVFRELRDVEEFMEKVEERFKVLEKKAYYIIEDIAREVFLTDPVHAELLELV